MSDLINKIGNYVVGLYLNDARRVAGVVDQNLDQSGKLLGMLREAYETAVKEREKALQDTPEIKSIREAFESHYKYLDFAKMKDAWGRPIYAHTHIEAMWLAWKEATLKFMRE